jgi:hypothetical protein
VGGGYFDIDGLLVALRSIRSASPTVELRCSPATATR